MTFTKLDREIKKGEKMRVRELVIKLNVEIKKEDFTKIHTHTELHKLIKESVISLLPNNLNLGLWDIQNGSSYEDKVISYSRDFVQYKNCKYPTKGKFSNIRFNAVEEVANIEIEKLNEFFGEKHRKEEILNLQNYIAKEKQEIVNAEKRLREIL